MTSPSSMGMPALLLACLLLASPMSAAHAGDAKTASSSHDVWLKRAQSNADAFMTGMASWYGADFHNKKTASGEGYDMYTFTAAHRTRTLPAPCAAPTLPPRMSLMPPVQAMHWPPVRWTR